MSKARRSSLTTSKKQPEHALPLQLALASLLVKLHPLNLDAEPVYPYSATFTAAVLHIVSREAFEFSDPATYDSLTEEMDALLKAECKALRRKNRLLRARGLAVPAVQLKAEEYSSWIKDFAGNFTDSASGCSYLDAIEHEMSERISEKMDEDMAETQEPLEYRSPLALFLRSLVISLRKLSFEDTAHVARQIAQWCGIKVSPVNTRNVLLLDRPSDTNNTRSTAMAQYQAAVASGDYALAITSLKRFYDHKFPGNTKSQHAHGLLNLALFYHQTGGVEAARTAVEEAIRIARKDGDKGCLQHCMTLLHQITVMSQPGPSTSSARRAVLSHLPHPSSANGELTMLLTALDLGEPLPEAFQRIHLALARHIKGDASWTQKSPLDLSAWHMVQARMWDDMGVEELAVVHEDLALDTEDSQRMTVVISRAMRTWTTDHAISQMLSADVIDGMSFAEYTRWSEAIWDILHRQAEMRDDSAALSLIHSLRTTPRPNFRDRLWHLHRSLEISPPHIILPDILKILQSARDSGAWRIHRLATVIMADALLKLDQGMGPKVVDIIQGVIQGEEDVAALASLVLGKAQVEIGLQNEDLGMIKHALKNLQHALRLARTLRYRKVAEQASSILAMLALMSDAEECAGLSEEWSHDNTVDTAESAKFCSRIQQIAEVVKLVAVTLQKPKI